MILLFCHLRLFITVTFTNDLLMTFDLNQKYKLESSLTRPAVILLCYVTLLAANIPSGDTLEIEIADWSEVFQ